MDLKQAMTERHTVRAYTERALSPDVVQQVTECVQRANAAHDVAIELVRDDATAFNRVLRLVLAKGVRNYLILAGDEAPDVRERLGWAGAELMLRCQALGLNTWWVGGTFSHARVRDRVPGKQVIGVIAVGYGATQGKPHASKRFEDVAEYEGAIPSWFRDGVRAALLAPTALNRQAFKISGSGRAVRISYEPGTFSGEDLGIVKYHFALGAGEGNFRWE